MAVPKRKTSKHRKRKRRSHLALAIPGISKCDRCGTTKKPHTVCDSCGYYKGEEVIPKSLENEI